METVQENSSSKLHEASSNGWILANFQNLPHNCPYMDLENFHQIVQLSTKYPVLIKHPYLRKGQSFLHAVKTVQLSSANETNCCWNQLSVDSPCGVIWERIHHIFRELDGSLIARRLWKRIRQHYNTILYWWVVERKCDWCPSVGRLWPNVGWKWKWAVLAQCRKIVA